MGLQLILVVPHYPYYFTYYNPLLGGNAAAEKTMIVGWGEGLDAAARWLNGQPNAQEIEVVAWYSTTFEPYFEGQSIYKIGEEKISRTTKPGLAADYVIFYINQIQRELPSPGALQFFQAEPPVHVVSLKGGHYAWIYPSLSMQQVIENEARLVGQVELLGYNLLAEAGPPMTDLASNSTTLVQLYREWQGKQPDEPIGLSLVDQSGQTWGWGNPLGTEARYSFEVWQEGMVAYDEFALSIFPGTPPGEYILKAWIDRPATGEVVGVFPLNDEDVRLRVVRPATPPALADLDLAQPHQVSLSDGVTLLGGSDLAVLDNHTPWQPGQTEDLLLYWRADQTLDQQIPVILTLSETTGLTQAEWSGNPGGGRFPTDQWQAGDIVRDPWTLTLPPYVPPGQYDLQVQLGAGEAFSLATVMVGGRPRTFEIPTLDWPLEAHFGPSITLLGLQADQVVISSEASNLQGAVEEAAPTPGSGLISGSGLIAQPGHPLQVTLVWHSPDLVAEDYTVTVQLLDGENQVRAQRDAVPLDGAAPTTSWARGEVISDQVNLDIPTETGPAPHRLLIALYRPETGQRLNLLTGADHVEIPVLLH